MLPRLLIPTPLVTAAAAEPLVERQPRVSRFRLLHVSAALTRWVFASLRMWLTRKWTPRENARRLREEIEGLGGFWIKIGQILSLRRDFFSEEFCQELGRLQDRASTFPSAIARRIIEKELGAPIEELFSDFRDQPIAAASIAQIHKARDLKSGRWLAIKVQRPEAETNFKKDMVLVRLLFNTLDRLRILPFFRWRMMVWELERVLDEEVDYRVEATSINRMRLTLAEHEIHAPEVFEELSTRRVLSMEFMDGVFMSDYIKAMHHDPEVVRRWEEENNVDPALVSGRLYKSLMRQLFEDNLFHGDLHPGNIILLRDSKIALIDFGSIGTLEKSYQRTYQLFVKSLVECEYRRAADVLLLLASSIPVVQISDLQEDLIRAMRKWTDRALTKGLPYHERSVSSNFTDLGNVMYKYKVWMDWAFLRINRTHLTLDSSLEHLHPDMHYVDTLSEYFDQAKWRALNQGFCVSYWVDNIVQWMSVASAAPDFLLELGLFRAPILRRQLQALQGATTKFSFLGEILFSRLRQLTGMALIGGAAAFAKQHFGWQPWQWLSELLDPVPLLEKGEWLAVLVVGLIVYRTFRALERRFVVEDVQVASR